MVDALQAGQPESLAAFYTRYYGEMIDFATNYVHDLAAAEEVVQDAWAAIIEGIDKFEGKSAFKTWAYKILANKARLKYQRESRLSAIKRALAIGFDSDETPCFDRSGTWAKPVERWQASPEDLLLAAEFQREMQDFVASLPRRQRDVFVLQDIEGWSPEKICELLGVSEGNQRVLRHRAHAAIYQWYSSKTRGER